MFFQYTVSSYSYPQDQFFEEKGPIVDTHCLFYSKMLSCVRYAIHYQTCIICRVSQTLDKSLFALDNAFTECYTQQKTLGKYFIGKVFFLECFFVLDKEIHSTTSKLQKYEKAIYFLPMTTHSHFSSLFANPVIWELNPQPFSRAQTRLLLHPYLNHVCVVFFFYKY